MATYFRRDEFVKAVTGPAIAGALVYVCTQPANSTNNPPSPLAAIYGDSEGITPLTQPLTTDGFGHTYFYVASGLYTVVIVNNGVIQQVYADQLIGDVITLETNGTPNGSQTLLDLVEGTNISLVDDGFGNVTVTNTQVLPVVTIQGRGFSIQFSYTVGAAISSANPSCFLITKPEIAQADVYTPDYTQIENFFDLGHEQVQCEYGVNIGFNANWQTFVKFDTLETNIKSHFSIGFTSFLASSDPLAAGYCFGVTAIGGTANWQAFVTVNGTPSYVDTGVAVDTNPHNIVVYTNGDIYIDGTEVATVNTSGLLSTNFYYATVTNSSASLVSSGTGVFRFVQGFLTY